MERTQIYLTTEQRARVSLAAEDAGVSKAEIIRRLLDEALGLNASVRDRLEAVEETAGLLAEAPDWQDWLAQVRGNGSDRRLTELGL